MDWLRSAIVCLFNAAIWDGARDGRIPLADLPALHGWMKTDWPGIELLDEVEVSDAWATYWNDK